VNSRLLLLVCALLIALAGCVTPGGPGPSATPTPGGQALPAAVLAAQKLLAQQLGLEPGSVTVVRFEKVDWPNSCLGIDYLDRLCADVITPGYRVILAAGGIEYEFHTDESGSQVLAAAPPGGTPGVPSAVIFTWHRVGGIAGFCDDLAVYATGEVYASNCGRQTPRPLGQRRLTAAELEQLNAWVDRLAAFDYTQPGPPTPVSDAMTIQVVFVGTGQETASPEEMEAIQEFAANLFADVSR
jgi:hypothetical protein